MKRQSKQQCNIRLEPEQITQLKELSVENKISVSCLIRTLITDYLKFYLYNKKNQRNVK